MNPQDPNNPSTTPSGDANQPNTATPQEEVTVSFNEEATSANDPATTPAGQPTDTSTPSLSSDQPSADMTQQQGDPATSFTQSTPTAEATNSETPVGTPPAVEEQPVVTPLQPENPYANSVETPPVSSPEQQPPVPGALPAVPPAADKKTFLILGAVAVVLIAAIAVLLFM